MAVFPKFLFIISVIIIALSFASLALGATETNNPNTPPPPPQCGSDTGRGCRNKAAALKLKIIAIAAILVSSMVGVCAPMFSKMIPAVKPDTDLFVLIKAFASGVILATGYMHVMPDSFNCLRSACLPEKPWKKFPFTTFVDMLSAVLTLMVDSFAMSFYKKHKLDCSARETVSQQQDSHHAAPVDGRGPTQLLRYRVVAQAVLEMGIIVHSVVIGLSLGASENPCTIRPLVAALCFHQLFEGMGLGGCILQAEYGLATRAIMAFFFSATTPFGIVMGIGVSNVYSDNSPTALIVVGLLNACSAGLLNYMALVDLLASDFMGNKLQKNMKLQTWAYVAVLLGAGGMSVMALWA
nr:fe(2+) transport protein 1-like [Ipomoea batatas]